MFAATYTGGSLNFVAVAEAVGLQDSSQLSAALAIDNIFGVGFILLLNLAAGWSLFQRWYGWRADRLGERLLPVEDADAGGASLFGLLSALAVSAAAVAVSGAVSTALGIANYEMLVLTVIVTVLATLGRSVLAGLKGEDVIAMMFMYLFFAIIGAGADLGEMLQAAPGMFVMVGCIFVVHALAVLAVGRLLKLNYAEMVTASLACIAGPPIAAAIAILFKWRNLVAPGILTGILGYVLGNFAAWVCSPCSRAAPHELSPEMSGGVDVFENAHEMAWEPGAGAQLRHRAGAGGRGRSATARQPGSAC